MALPPLPTTGGPRSAALAERVDARMDSDATKEDPTVVNYRPADDDRTCGDCDHFTPEPPSSAGSCELVAGAIDPAWVCDLWEAATPEPVMASPTPPQGGMGGL